ncbi:hypothetical protein PORY_001996 [Pneumocystis oryctolagi]|uniref:Uncharacterized protein n=1 Tax=Pneumocystis oryctolagi TaxID=42067 RepID=A0ACB7CAL4_9ASCO|nr:hypothetical protein PORY_001996 [Pneumocystis oryctolagi]
MNENSKKHCFLEACRFFSKASSKSNHLNQVSVEEKGSKTTRKFGLYSEKNDEKEGLHSHSQSVISDTSSYRFLEKHRSKDPLIKREYKHMMSSDTSYSKEMLFQEIKLDNENYIRIYGFNINKPYQFLYYILCIITGGFAYLIFLWVPQWKAKLTLKSSPFDSCNWVLIKDKYERADILKVTRKDCGESILNIYEGFQNSHDKFQTKNESSESTYLTYIDYRYIRFVYYPIEKKFIPIYDWKDPRCILPIQDISKGLDTSTRNDREIIFGKNIIDVEEDSVFVLLIKEIFHYFYIFQIFSIALWMSDTYYYYATCILIISIINVTVTLIKTKKNIKLLRKMSRYICDVRVLRDGTWISTLSSELVPGDIFDISDPKLTVMPCSSILLSGDCIVNESSLTGESAPISKIFAPPNVINLLNREETDIPRQLLKHYIFCGTKIVKVRKPLSKDQQTPALAMVAKTGFNTTKGILIRSIFFQKIPSFKFYRDSLRFVGFMTLIALSGFIINTIRFVKMGIEWNLVVLRSLDLITIVVPPALPTTLAIGTNFAIARLKKRQIYYTSISKINISGTIDIMCFDKTGTLTEDGLDVFGIRIVDVSSNKLGEIHKESLTLPFYVSNYNDLSPSNRENAMLYTMATCHSLRLLNHNLIGDPLDLKMFCFTGWVLEENQEHVFMDESFENIETQNITQDFNQQIVSSVVRPKKDLRVSDIKDSNLENISSFKLGIIRTLEFVSHLRRMSVIVKEFDSPNMQVYLKGAPEIIKDVCRLDSLPDNYDEVLSYYTSHGFRVIACAMKTLFGISWIETQKMKRDEIEKDLLFIGFIIFENRLKPMSSKTIDILNKANIRSVICTGDNILTSINVSKKCNIIQKNEHVYMATIHGDVNSPDAKIIWENTENSEMLLDSNTLIPQYSLSNPKDSSYYGTCFSENYSLAITGDIFKWMIDFSPSDVFEKMLVKTQVFARMSPDEKHILVEKLQSLDYCVGFCGDGANDCSALKAANVSISLSDTEASIVSSFTDKKSSVACVIDLIREGRAALVTSFACFKYMALYSAIQFISVSILYSSASNLGDFQYLYIDLILVFPIAISMGRSEAYPKLVKERPVSSLISEKVIGSLIGNISILLSLQFAVYYLVRLQDWYQKPSPQSDLFDISNSDNTSLFIFSCYQYVLIAIILSIGPPYRQPVYYNKVFVFFVLVSLISITVILYKPTRWISRVLELSYLKLDFCFIIVGIAVFNYIIIWVCEKYLFLPTSKQINSIIKTLFSIKKTEQKKRYEKIQDALKC